MNKKALIAMSGGVDSSVSALMMLEQDYECTGVTMKLFANEDIGVSKANSCCSIDDVADARSVATSLGMLYYVWEFPTTCSTSRTISSGRSSGNLSAATNAAAPPTPALTATVI